MATTFPEWLEPMAATLTQERFTGAEWIFERKFDGIRLIAFKRGADVQLYSRNRLLQNPAYPAVVDAVEALPVRDAILDGEATGVWGKAGRVAYHVFDVLWLDGRDTTALPLDERRQILKALPLRPPLQRVAEITGPEPWTRACAEGWEGVIAKRRDSRYEHRRSPHWLKMKCEASQELVVGGFTDPQGTRVGLGALLVGYYEPAEGSGSPRAKSRGSPRAESRGSPRAESRGSPRAKSRGSDADFVFAGKIGTGFDTKMLLDLRSRLDALEIEKPPFTRAIGLPRLRAHWVQPEIVVQVAFIEWTVNDKLRHPRLLGIRFDKRARDVVRER